jgi:hypothetical protein
VIVADVLAHYGTVKAPELAHPELVGYHLTPLLKHFGSLTCWRSIRKPAGLTSSGGWPASLGAPSHRQRRAANW